MLAPQLLVQQELNKGKILGKGDLEVVARAFHAQHAAACALHERCVVGTHKAIGPRGILGAAQGVNRKDLRRLNSPSSCCAAASLG